MSNINISIITLKKNDDKKFLRTLKSLKSQQKDFKIEWIIVDGSDFKNQKDTKQLINQILNEDEKKYFSLKYINSKRKNISGIYACMNYGKNLARGKFIIFLNSGDIFYNNNSLRIFFNNSLYADPNNCIIFGQANIISPIKINWYFPGSRLKDIEKWLRIFEPNHQSMLVGNKLAKDYDFPENYSFIADGIWKRKILNNAYDIIYIKKPLVKFFLDGVSSIKPNKEVLKNIFKNKNINFIRKLIFVSKYFLPNKLFFIYYLMQKYKSLLIDLLL